MDRKVKPTLCEKYEGVRLTSTTVTFGGGHSGRREKITRRDHGREGITSTYRNTERSSYPVFTTTVKTWIRNFS